MENSNSITNNFSLLTFCTSNDNTSSLLRMHCEKDNSQESPFPILDKYTKAISTNAVNAKLDLKLVKYDNCKIEMYNEEYLWKGINGIVYIVDIEKRGIFSEVNEFHQKIQKFHKIQNLATYVVPEVDVQNIRKRNQQFANEGMVLEWDKAGFRYTESRIGRNNDPFMKIGQDINQYLLAIKAEASGNLRKKLKIALIIFIAILYISYKLYMFYGKVNPKSGFKRRK